ncbi:MAG: hypothetical protein LBU34_04485 [Planctomycetaceae bacterium]|nr:hypothetical protein [Planctomycetaceae bacterium]
MCITGGGAKRNRRITSPKNKSPAGTRLWLCWLFWLLSPLDIIGELFDE